ncbi:MAG: hypothetical protein ACQESN_05250 [Thermotogota bacterium]
MKKYFSLLLLLLFSVFSFSSAKILTTENSNYYLEKQNNKILYPFYSEDNIDFENVFEIEIPLKYENRIYTNFQFPTSWYVSSSINQNLNREIVLENNPLINFYFKSNYADKFYAQYTGDFQISDTAYFEYGNYSLYNLPEMTYMSLDFPQISYISLREDDFSFLIGRNKLSIGPLKYDLLLSESTPYYDNFSFNYSINKNFDYRFSWVSSIPFMSKEEYSEYFENQESLSGYRNDFVNNINYKKNNNNIGISMLNHITENIPNPIQIFLLSDRGLASMYYLNEAFFDIYFEGVMNYNTFSKGIGTGISKTFEMNTMFLKTSFEYYYTEKNLYKAEKVYDDLYYRSFSLSNTPGARLMFDYPFGLKYGDNSNIYNISLITYDKKGNGYLDINYDFGIFDNKKLKNFNIKSIIDLKYFDLKMTYNNLNIEENQTQIFNFHIIFDLKISI